MIALELLGCAANPAAPDTSSGRLRTAIVRAEEREFQWNLSAGLGPLLFWGLQADLEGLPDARREQILAADLSAKVWYGQRVAAANDVIDRCRDLGVVPTLLKGLSVCSQYYPVPHARPMGDIDVLVDPDARPLLERELMRRGYQPAPGFKVTPGAKHGAPLLDTGRGIWIEIHSALFDRLREDEPFGKASVDAHRVSSSFCGRPVMRLSPEFQLVYLSYSWMGDASRYMIEIQPSGLPPVFDAVFILASETNTTFAESLVGCTEHPLALGCTYLMLAHIRRHFPHFVAPELLDRLRARQALLGGLQLRVMHDVLDRYLLAGRRWHKRFPLPVPGRYSARYQLRKRLSFLFRC